MTPYMCASGDSNSGNAKTEHLHLALRSIREVDRLLMKMEDRPQLLQKICDTLIKYRSYYNAWIVLVSEDNRVLEVVEAGLGGDFQPMFEQLNRSAFTDCGRRALGQKDIVIIDDPYEACTDCPLSAKYSGRSAMTVRLENKGRVFGLLCVSIPRQFAKSEEERELLQEIAGDIAFGLSKMALENELRENQRSLRDLVESSPTGILIVQDGTVVYRNPEHERISGSNRQVGKKLDFDNVHLDDVEKVKKFYKEIASGVARTVDADFRLYPAGTKNQRANMKWVHCRASSIDYKGKEAVLINMIDITQAKEFEQLVIVKDKMASLGHIAAGVAHEIRNPLSGINIYLNTLENVLGETEKPEKTREIFRQIQSASRKIESIIKRIIDFSKPSEPEFVLTDINKPVEEALELSSVTLRKNGVKIQKSLADDFPQCHMDPTLIEEVVLNLITNASEAMKRNDGEKLIRVTTYSENEHIFVRVSDSGPGIPPELRTKVLEPFYTTKKSGTGIGLSLCHRIVTDHGGSLAIEESEWAGAEFVVKLPTKRQK